ncbi:MAG: hypothetical protein WBS19_09850 [Candidatus Korobacteraceae bacterium]
MRKKRSPAARGDSTILTFAMAAVVGVLAAAVAEDLRYFAEGSPDSFLQTWRIQPVSMFVGSLVFVTTLYLLQRLNDRQHALNYVFPYMPLVVFSGIDLAARLNPLWVAVVAAACLCWSILQIHFLQSS